MYTNELCKEKVLDKIEKVIELLNSSKLETDESIDLDKENLIVLKTTLLVNDMLKLLEEEEND